MRLSVVRFGLLVTLLSIYACGGGDGGNGGSSGGNASLERSDFAGVKLTLGSQYGTSSGSEESDYYLYADGSVDYIFRSVIDSSPPTTRLQWTFEGSSLFVNNGSKKLGSGLASPKELQFLSAPSVGDLVRVKHGDSVFNTFKLVAVSSASKESISLSENDLYGKAIEFSDDGSTSYSSVTRLKFTSLSAGVWESRTYSKEFVWSLVSSNKLRISFDNDTFSEYEFASGLSLGSTVFTYRTFETLQPMAGQTLLANIYLL